MPTLLELQRAMRASLVDRDDGAIAAMLAENVPAGRLNIYRNTFVTGVTKALRLSYPAIHRLVGADFFESAAAVFLAQHPPRAAYLDEYGEEFPEFLAAFAPAVSLVYLADVARLEWAVNRAIHAHDAPPLDLARLAALSLEEQARVCFQPHPSVALLRTDYPADAIWRGVLSGDDEALAAIDLNAGPANLLVERGVTGVDASRLDEAAWNFAASLCEGRSIAASLAAVPDSRTNVLLAEHLAAGRFIDFNLAPLDMAASAVTSLEAAQ